MIAYADTGFLVSLYHEDDHSARATALVESKATFLLTPLLEVEFANALQLAVFRKRSTHAEIRMILEIFAQHQSTGLFRVVPLGPDIWEKTIALTRRHTAKLGVRTLDVIHVAAALLLAPDIFYSFDERQRKLARAEGLRVLPA